MKGSLEASSGKIIVLRHVGMTARSSKLFSMNAKCRALGDIFELRGYIV